MKMFTLSEMRYLLEGSQSQEPKESLLPKTYSNRELENLIEKIDCHFLFNYNAQSFFNPKQACEMECFLELREEILNRLSL